MIERITPAIVERHGRVTVNGIRRRHLPRSMQSDRAGLSKFLENSLRHATADEIAIRVRGRRVGPDIEIVFSDNGPGIPYSDQAHIFERFYRVHKDRSRGLGVALA